MPPKDGFTEGYVAALKLPDTLLNAATPKLPTAKRVKPTAGKIRLDARDFQSVAALGPGTQTVCWGYWPHGQNPPASGTVPVAIEVMQGQALTMQLTNNLSSKRPIVDVYDGMGMLGRGVGSTVVHLHGALVPAESDGFPVAMDSRENVIRRGHTGTYQYPNAQPATMLWFHDHSMDMTAKNVYTGLAGIYIIRDPKETVIGLPTTTKRELLLLLGDKSFSSKGEMIYGGLFDGPHSQVPEFKGDVLTLNGVAHPTAKLEAGTYRLRIVNACTSRFVRLVLQNGSGVSQPITVIGTDHGFVPNPSLTTTTDGIAMAPAERVDLLVELGVGNYKLVNDVRFESGNDDSVPTNILCYPSLEGNGGDFSAVGGPAFTAMKINVVATGSSGPGSTIGQIVARWSELSHVGTDADLQTVVAAVRAGTRLADKSFVLSELDMGARITLDRTTPLEWNGLDADLNGLPPREEVVHKNTIEVWAFRNDSPDTHPMHIHQCTMQLISRTFDPPAPAGVTPTPPLPTTPHGLDAHEEATPKDTVRIANGCTTLVAMKFGPNAGRSVWHCHILEHEDMGMMRQLVVL
jgi:spore coat protein A, manganese oxidase